MGVGPRDGEWVQNKAQAAGWWEGQGDPRAMPLLGPHACSLAFGEIGWCKEDSCEVETIWSWVLTIRFDCG